MSKNDSEGFMNDSSGNKELPKMITDLSQVLKLDPPKDMTEMEQDLIVMAPDPLLRAASLTENLSENQTKFLLMKLHGMTDKKAREAVGIETAATVWRWKQDEEFKKAYDEVVNNPVEFARDQLNFAATKAVTRLTEFLDHRNVAVVQYAIDRILAIVGLEKPKKIEVEHTSKDSREELEELLDEWRKYKQDSEGSGAREVQNEQKLLRSEVLHDQQPTDS